MRSIEASANNNIVLKIARHSCLGMFLVLLANNASEFALWLGVGILATGYYRVLNDQSRLMKERTVAFLEEYERLQQESAELRIKAILTQTELLRELGISQEIPSGWTLLKQ